MKFLLGPSIDCCDMKGHDIAYEVIELRNVTIDEDFGYLGRSGIDPLHI